MSKVKVCKLSVGWPIPEKPKKSKKFPYSWILGVGKATTKYSKSMKIAQNKPFLPQYRPDMVMIWSHMASIPMSLSHTTPTRHIHPCIGPRGPGRAISIVKIHQKSLKYKHF